MATLPKFPDFKSFINRDSDLDTYLKERYLRDMTGASALDYSRIFGAVQASPSDVLSMISDPIIFSAMALLMETAFQPQPDQPLFRVTSRFPAVKAELDAFHDDFAIPDTLLTLAWNLLAYGNVPIKLHWDDKFRLQRYSFVQTLRQVIPVQLSGKTIGYMDNGTFHDPHEYLYSQLMHYKDLGLGMNSKIAIPDTDRIVNEFTLAPSYIGPASRPWRSVKIIEDSLLMMRMDKSNFFRIIGVKTGDNVATKNSIKLLNFYRQIFKKVRRVSFDGNGMSGTGPSNEYEVVVPVTDSQSLDVKEIGGEVEVTALKDLEIQYQRLFASLRLQPSFIGFSQDNPNSMGGDAVTTRWDERFARLVKSLIYSSVKTIKQLDVMYLRSRGYDVRADDFQFQFQSVSTVEDEERRIAMDKYTTSAQGVMSFMDQAGVDYDRDYLVKTMVGQIFGTTHVDPELLFKSGSATDRKVESINTSKSSLVGLDLIKNYNFLASTGMVDPLPVQDSIEFIRSSMEDGATDKAQPSKVQINSSAITVSPELIAVPYERYLANPVQTADMGYLVSLDQSVKAIAIQREAFTPIKAEKGAVFNLPMLKNVTSAVDRIPARDLVSGEFDDIETLYIHEGSYYLEGKDLVNYLAMQERGMTKITVRHLFEKKD